MVLMLVPPETSRWVILVTDRLIVLPVIINSKQRQHAKSNPFVSGGKWGLTPAAKRESCSCFDYSQREGSDPIFPPRLTGYNGSYMKDIPKRRKPVSAESIGKRVERGEDVSRYFTNTGRMMPPVQRVNVDFAKDMLQELDAAARELNVSRQAVIKIFVRQALNQHYLAQRARDVK